MRLIERARKATKNAYTVLFAAIDFERYILWKMKIYPSNTLGTQSMFSHALIDGVMLQTRLSKALIILQTSH